MIPEVQKDRTASNSVAPYDRHHEIPPKAPEGVWGQNENKRASSPESVADGHLRPEDKYTPTVWLFLAYRYNFKDQQKPCRFINMCWNSDGTAPKSLIKVNDYYVRNNKPKQHRPVDDRPTGNRRQSDNRQSYQLKPSVPRFKPFNDDKKVKSTHNSVL